MILNVSQACVGSGAGAGVSRSLVPRSARAPRGNLELSTSDVLRRGLIALERELLDPASHPALRLVGSATEERGATVEYDVAKENDGVLTSGNERSPGSRWRSARRDGVLAELFVDTTAWYPAVVRSLLEMNKPRVT